jgi:hypothetical protein
MRTNVIQKAGREVISYELEYNDDKTQEKKELIIKIQEPSFEEVCEAYKYIYDENGTLDMIKPGKLIYDLCCIDTDPILLKNNRLLMSVCAKLTTIYTLPIITEIKKKD